MKTIRRLIYGEILLAVGFVLLAFLSLFFFFDLMDELSSVGSVSQWVPGATYTLSQALLFTTLLVPSRVYELMPIAVLIGSVFVLARFARNSEFTVLRTSGLGPWRALRTLLGLGLVFVVLTWVMGDYVAPWAGRTGQLLKAQYKGGTQVGQTGAWLKEKQTYSQYSVNVKSLTPTADMTGVRIFEFDNQGLFVSSTQAESATVQDDGAWLLRQVKRQELEPAAATNAASGPRMTRQTLADMRWPSALTADMVAVALLKPERMRTVDLFSYVRHLQANGQSAQQYEIEFWRKLFYPLSCMVMVVLALPFAYLHFRSGNLTGYVFLGVMFGISFFLLNNVFGYIGNLQQWRPWLAAAAPALIYSVASLAAFSWLVLRR